MIMNNDINNNDIPEVISEQTIVLRSAFQYCTERYTNYQLLSLSSTKTVPTCTATTVSFHKQHNCSDQKEDVHVQEEQQKQQQQNIDTDTDTDAVACNDNNNNKVSKPHCTFTRAMNIVQQQQQQQQKQKQYDDYSCPITINSIENINTMSCNEFRLKYQIYNQPCIIRNVQDIVLTNDTIFSKWISYSSTDSNTTSSSTSKTTSCTTTVNEVLKSKTINSYSEIEIENENENENDSHTSTRCIDGNNNITSHSLIGTNSSINNNTSFSQQQKTNTIRQWFIQTVGNDTIVPVRRKEKQKHKQMTTSTLIDSSKLSSSTLLRQDTQQHSQQQTQQQGHQLDIDGRATITEKVIPMKLCDWIQILDDSIDSIKITNNTNHEDIKSTNNNNDNDSNRNVNTRTIDSITSKATVQCNLSMHENYTCYEYYLKDWHLQSWIRNNINRSSSSNSKNNNNNAYTKLDSKSASTTTTVTAKSNGNENVAIINNTEHSSQSAHSYSSQTQAEEEQLPEQQQPLLYNVLEHFQYDLLNNFLIQFSLSSSNKYLNEIITSTASSASTSTTCSMNDYMFVYWGPKGSSTDRHSDVMNSFSWSYNVIGSKLWTFYFPNHHDDDVVVDDTTTNNDKVNNLNNDDNITTIQIIQKANEIIFLPCQLQHSVLNLEETISINHNWITTANIHSVWDCIYTEIQAIDNELVLWNDTNLVNDYEIKENMLHGCVGINISSFIFMILVRLLDLLNNNNQAAAATTILDENKPSTNNNNANTINECEIDDDDEIGNDENDYNSQVLYWYDIIQLVSILAKVSSTSCYTYEQQQQPPTDSSIIHLQKRLTAMLQCEQSATETIAIINTILTTHEQYIAAVS